MHQLPLPNQLQKSNSSQFSANKNARIVLMRAFFMRYKKDEAVTQDSLFPVSLNGLITSDHSARTIAFLLGRLVGAETGDECFRGIKK